MMMNSDTLAALLARLKMLEAKATKGPWYWSYEISEGDVNQGPPFEQPRYATVKLGECVLCRYLEAPLISTYEKKGRMIHRHKFHKEENDWHQIENDEGVEIAGMYDWEEGGIMYREDAELICEMRNALLVLCAAIEAGVEA